MHSEFRMGIYACILPTLLVATYNDVNGEEDLHCPVSSPECVGEEGSDEWRDE